MLRIVAGATVISGTVTLTEPPPAMRCSDGRICAVLILPMIWRCVLYCYRALCSFFVVLSFFACVVCTFLHTQVSVSDLYIFRCWHSDIFLFWAI